MKIYLAECIGTFGLVFCGTGAIMINEETHGLISHAGVAVTWGLIVMAMIYSFNTVSGAHINPAVTIGLYTAGLFPAKKIAPYFAAQLTGALAASLLLTFLFPENKNLGATIPAGSDLQSFILEIILGFFLMTVILFSSANKETAPLAGMIIGATILLEAMFAGPITGASMNPARSIAPDIIRGNISTLWIYLLAPTIGCLMGSWFWRYMVSDE